MLRSRTLQEFGDWKVTTWGIEYTGHHPDDIPKGQIHSLRADSKMVEMKGSDLLNFSAALTFARKFWKVKKTPSTPGPKFSKEELNQEIPF
jgi:hypothetical protein